MTVKAYWPQLEVTLIKLVARKDGVAERYKAAARTLDLTGFLGDTGVVRTIKGIVDAAGGFSVSFPDKIEFAAKDTPYALVEPGDMVEIRAARNPDAFLGQKLPLIMRGFVSSVRRSRSMGQDGQPEAVTIVSGQDSGRFFQIFQMLHPLAHLQESAMLEKFQLQAANGIEAQMLPVAEFIRQVTERVINKKLQALSVFADRQVKPFRVDATVKEGVVSNFAVASFQGPYWSLVESFADRPWNEVFIEDEEEGPVLRFRPAPYRSIDGSYIGDGKDPGTISLTSADIVSYDVTRSDARIANFFWVPPGSSTLDTNQMVTVASLVAGMPLDFNHGNNRPELYGVKMMTVPTALLPTGSAVPPTHQPPDKQGQAGDDVILWHQKRADLLKQMNRDNSVLEEASITLQGAETLKVGRYLRLTQGELVSESYITRVAHSFMPFRQWTCTAMIERGTGFLVRNRLNRSPYWAEGRKGPYSK